MSPRLSNSAHEFFDVRREGAAAQRDAHLFSQRAQAMVENFQGDGINAHG
jgi:hypothetical protein